MGTLQPQTRSEFSTITLSRGDFPSYSYALDRQERTLFPEGSIATLEFRNSYDQVLDAWIGYVESGTVTFDPTISSADALPRGTAWTLSIEDDYGRPRQRRWGLIIRSEPTYPDAPPQSSEFDGVVYKYSFGTPGYVYDPAWRILHGRPRVWDNSLRELPNGVAAGGVLFADAFMMYFAPLRTDTVRLTYNTIRPTDNSDGECWVVVCSNYDGTNWAGFRHRQVWGIGSWDDDTIEIVTGDGTKSTDFDTRETIQAETANNQNYTAEYNELTNTFSLYKGDATEPLISWPDETEVVEHGEGERYWGLAFQSDIASAGVQISDVRIGDSLIVEAP